MHYNFLADKADKLEILKFIFEETNLHLYDLGSPYGQEICEYKTVDEIEAKFDLENGGKFANTFQLWSPRHKGQVMFRRVELDPKRCKGHTFRFATEGLGLIQLYFGGIQNNELNQSHIGHLTEKRALVNQSTISWNETAEQWNWEEIEITSRKLKYQIHSKLAIKKNWKRWNPFWCRKTRISGNKI